VDGSVGVVRRLVRAADGDRQLEVGGCNVAHIEKAGFFFVMFEIRLGHLASCSLYRGQDRCYIVKAIMLRNLFGGGLLIGILNAEELAQVLTAIGVR